MTALTLQAPAKINLWLEVLGRRDDGFHELATVLQTLELCDTLQLDLRDPIPGRPDVDLQLDDPAGTTPAGDDNLVVRAARVLLAAADRGATVAVDIRLTKAIPAGGGLGGGSSDAAAVLTGLNDLLGQPCGEDALAALAAGLGSDVPFFLRGGTALGTGRGEHITPLRPPRPFEVTLLLPGYGVPTPAVYGALDAPAWTGDHSSEAETVCARLADAEAQTLQKCFRNDLEQAASHVEPRLQRWLAHPSVHLSGSGSTLFCFGAPDTDLAKACAADSIRLMRTSSRKRATSGGNH